MKIILLLTLVLFGTTSIAQCDVSLWTYDYNGSDVTCNGNCDAKIYSYYNGTPPYSYSWSTGDTTPNIYNQCPGIYVLTMTDDTGCIAIDSIEITEPAPVSVQIHINQPIDINSICTGSIGAYTTGGVANSWTDYNFEWFDCTTGQLLNNQSQSLQGLCAGEYGVTVTDDNGCADTTCFTLEIDTCLYVSTQYYLGSFECLLGVFSSIPIDSYQWVDCQNGYSPFPGDTSIYYSTPQSGDVAIIINALGCVDTSQCYPACIWGLDELDGNSKKTVRITDILGNDVPEQPNKLLIYHYSDGTIERRYQLK